MGRLTNNINFRLTSVVFFFIFVCIVFLVYYVNSSTKDLIIQNETRSMKTIGDGIAHTLSDRIESVKAMDTTLASQNEAVLMLTGNTDIKPHLENEYRKLLTNDHNYSGVTLLDMQGHPVLQVSGNNLDLSSLDIKNEAWFEQALEEKKPYVSKSILYFQQKSIALLPFTAPVLDSSEKQIGVLALFLDWNVFTSRFLDSVRVAGKGYGYILDNKGNVIAHAVDKTLLGKSVASFDFIQKSLSMKYGVLEYNWKGKKKIMSLSYIPENGSNQAGQSRYYRYPIICSDQY